MTTPHILVVDDEPDIRHLVQEILEDEGYAVAVAEDGKAARAALRHRRPDLVLLDIWMPDVDGVTLLKEWTEAGELDFPVIMISGHGTVETAVEATRLGAYDFLEKPLSLAKLLVTVERALESDHLQKENAGLQKQLSGPIEPIGHSAVMQSLRERIRRVAQADTAVLLTGEPGSGKQTAARYLHSVSRRSQGPFIAVRVGAIAAENSSVELFGSEEGGKVHYGRLEQANGGILFLDEVADMDAETQARLLSALEGRSFLRVGGIEPVEVDVRVVASSHRDLEAEVAAGRFRKELYYQLNVLPVHIPPLREHTEDVPELIRHYTDLFVEQHSLGYRHFTTAAQNRLRNYAWPGNVMELINLIQRLLILSTGEEIGLEEVDAAIGGTATTPSTTTAAAPDWFDLPLREARERFEHAYFETRLKELGGNVSKLAQAAGMERTNLYRKLKSLGIDPKKAGA